MKKLTFLSLAGGVFALCLNGLSAQTSGITQAHLDYTGTVFGITQVNLKADSNGGDTSSGVGTPGLTFSNVNNALQTFTFTSAAVAPAGLGLPSAVTGLHLFCIQIEEQTQDPQDVLFQNVAGSLDFRGTSNFNAGPSTSDRQNQLVKLYSAVFATGYNPANISGFSGSAADKAFAFQLAVWNVIYGGGLGTNGSDASITDTGGGSSSDFFQASSSSTVTGIANAMLNAAYTAQALPSMTLWALRSPVGSVNTGGGQDFVIPFYNETPGQTTPEPATYALLVGVATLGVVSIRRRFKAAA